MQSARHRNLSPWEYFIARLRGTASIDPCPVDDPSTLDSWKERFPGRLAELLGPRPETVPLNTEVLASEDCGSYRRDKIIFDSEAGMSVPAYLLVPHERDAPGPAVVAQHGHGPGKDQVCGIATVGPPNGDYGHQLAERGYIVLAPDLRAFGERADLGPPDRYHCDLTAVHMSMLGVNLLALDMWDLARGIDLLAGHPLVDPSRIGMVGLSQGGTMTLFMAAWDRRVAAAVVSGFFGSWTVSAAIPWNMCGSQILHGMLGQIDHVDLGAAVAPRALLIESGTEDPIFSASVAAHQWSRLSKVYRTLGVPERLGFDVFEGGHQWSGGRAYPFLEQWLGGGDTTT